MSIELGRIPSELVTAIGAFHAAPQRMVFIFAGAGSLALTWLHAVPGSSRSILEALDCYAPRSLAQVLGSAPAQAVSAASAQALAGWALLRAKQLAEPDWPLLGVACTAAIATDRARRGADQAFVTVATPEHRSTYHLQMHKTAHDRISEETLIAHLIIHALLNACAQPDPTVLPLRTGDYLTKS